MKQVLVLGAGQSSPYLIHHLLGLADAEDWFITVGDVDIDLARERVGGHRRASAIQLDVNDATVRSAQIKHADVVVNMLGPQHQDLVAWDCVSHGRHMLSVSYRTQTARDLDADARREGVLLLFELAVAERVVGISRVVVSFLETVMGGPEAWEANETIRRCVEIRDGVAQNKNVLTFQRRAAA